MTIKPWFRKFSAAVLTIFLSLTLLSLPANAFDAKDYEKLLMTNECNGCDLSGADLSGKELYGSALIGTKLANANLSGASLIEAKLGKADLTEANVSGADLSAVTLSEATLTKANFSSAVLYNARMDKAKLLSTTLTGADLKAAIISDADLSNAIARGANFNDAILIRSNLSHADFSNAKMRNTNLSKANLAEAKFFGADLFRAKMPNDTVYNGDVSQFGAYGKATANVAAKTSHEDELVALIPFSGTTPIFNPKKVRLGITPTVWSNSDDLSIDLVPPIPYQQILSEMALAGFKGSQGAPKFPKHIETLKKELKRRDLTISEPWVGTYFTIGDKKDSEKSFNEQMEFMKEIGGSNVMVVAELGGAIHQQPIDPLNNRPIFTDKQWKLLTAGLNDLGRKAYDAGMVLCYHPHIGTGVETLEDIDRLMEETNPKYLKLLLDTGHLYYAGVDPLEVT